MKHALSVQAGLLTGGERPRFFSRELSWLVAFAFVAALHVAVGVYLVSAAREALQDGVPQEAINIELVPEPSEPNDKPDDVAGPKVEDSAGTSEQPMADDPDPPAPEAPPPTAAKKEPDAKPDITAPPAPVEAQALLPPMEKPPERPADRPPVPKPPVEEKPELKEKVDQTAAPSQASSGSAALLSGGKRPSAAAQATWKGEIGTHLGKNRRYPQEARAQGMQGVVQVKVTIDDKGHVLDEKLVKSSGRQLLDGEALALMKRADPFPAPPAGLPAPITMTVPVNFSIR